MIVILVRFDWIDWITGGFQVDFRFSFTNLLSLISLFQNLIAYFVPLLHVNHLDRRWLTRPFR